MTQLSDSHKNSAIKKCFKSFLKWVNRDQTEKTMTFLGRLLGLQCTVFFSAAHLLYHRCRKLSFVSDCVWGCHLTVLSFRGKQISQKQRRLIQCLSSAHSASQRIPGSIAGTFLFKPLLDVFDLTGTVTRTHRPTQSILIIDYRSGSYDNTAIS